MYNVYVHVASISTIWFHLTCIYSFTFIVRIIPLMPNSPMLVFIVKCATLNKILSYLISNFQIVSAWYRLVSLLMQTRLWVSFHTTHKHTFNRRCWLKHLTCAFHLFWFNCKLSPGGSTKRLIKHIPIMLQVYGVYLVVQCCTLNNKVVCKMLIFIG